MTMNRLGQILFLERRLPKGLGLPLKRFLSARWKTNLHMIEIEITTLCNIACYNCDRSCGQAPSNERMTLEQIRKFVDESIALKWKWNWIKVLGGEPTLHPDVLSILEELGRLRKVYKDCVVEIITNGYADRTKEMLEGFPDGSSIANTAKTSRDQDFDAYNIAAVDTPGFDRKRIAKACPSRNTTASALPGTDSTSAAPEPAWTGCLAMVQASERSRTWTRLISRSSGPLCARSAVI